jgi:hypothetical protein
MTLKQRFQHLLTDVRNTIIFTNQWDKKSAYAYTELLGNSGKHATLQVILLDGREIP